MTPITQTSVMNDRKRNRKARIYKPRVNFYLANGAFIERYRFSPGQVEEILRDIGPQVVGERNGKFILNPRDRFLIALRYYASGDFCYSIGDSHTVSKFVVHDSIMKVTNALIGTYFKEIVSWPRTEAEEIAVKFHRKANFPGVCGAIDGTHVEILAPAMDEWQYVNRKGSHSLNVMAIAGPDYQFYAVNSNWPGSVHDSRVLQESVLCQRFREGWRPFPNAHLVGDLAYPLLAWLITPISEVEPTTRGINFNKALRKTRFTVENAFGILKSRFQCLKYVRVREPRKAAKIINACVILHNLLVKRIPQDAAEFDLEQDEGAIMTSQVLTAEDNAFYNPHNDHQESSHNESDNRRRQRDRQLGL